MTVRTALGVAALYVAMTMVMAYPFSLHPSGTTISSGQDPSLWVWTIGWDVHAFTHRPWAIFDANIFFPFRHTLAYSENLIGSAFLAAPIIWLGGSVMLAVNLIALASIPLSAFGAYLLGKRLGLSMAAAVLCGIVFGFSPPRFTRIDQFHMTTIQWVPFALAYLHTYVDAGRARDLRVAIAFFSLQALTSGHGGALLTLAVAMLIVWALVWGIVPRQPVALAKRVADIGLSGVCLLLPALLIYLPYRAARRDVPDITRTLGDWSVNASSFVSSGSRVQTWLLSHAPAWGWLRQEPDTWLFPGILPLLLAATAMVGAVRGASRRVVWLYAGMCLFSVWMAVGPPFGVWQWIYWLPGLSLVRVPQRFMIVGVLALGVLAGVGFDYLTARTPSRKSWYAALVGLCLAAEFAVMPIIPQPFVLPQPPIERWIATQPGPFRLVDLPLPDSTSLFTREAWTVRYMLHSMTHWQPVWEGYSGVQPPGYMDVWRTLVTFPDEASLAALAKLGVTHAILHTDLIDPADRANVEARLARCAPWLTLERQEPGGRLYSIHWK